ncbi:MAG TPA: transglycosylase domain-containing protein [Ilumatobacteraceae bacterium]|nr:transglycosylase domain-containing protein [Ilumatobacteraceae bacterium]
MGTVRLLGSIPRLLLIVAAGALLLTATIVGVAPRVWSSANAHEELPVVLPEFEALAQRTYVYDVKGQEIAFYELENSQPIAFEDIPQPVIDAFLVVEDKEFFTHDGINLRSLVRATLSNFASDSPQQGASTITMQVVKNDYLAGLERDGRYKLLQMHYARMLEKELSKQDIMARYLNTVFFGNNAYGIEAAAETYFGKKAVDLTFVESAFLAGLVRSPSGFDPINEPERSRARWLQVLDRLVDEELFTDVEAEAIAEEFVLPSRVKTLPERAFSRTYFTEALRDYLLNKTDILGDTYQERYNQLFRGGLRIHTTLDADLQALAEQARTELPDTPQGFDASIVSLDSTNGAIRVMVGGRGFVPNEREVNMALSPRQTGSSIKMFILAAAVQAGAQQNDLIDGPASCTFAVPDQPPFNVSAAGIGLATLQSHTTKSINCAFVRLSQIVGLNRVVDTTYRMAQSPYLYKEQPATERRPIDPFISFATGANELSPLDMAAGVQTLANEGTHHDPYYVDFIDTADGERLYSHLDPGTQVLDRNAALATVEIMKGPIYGGGTGRRAAFDNRRPAFGKTGTQEDNTNAWFVGGTKQLATAVWVGDPNAYTPMRYRGSDAIAEFRAAGYSGAGVQGGHFPAAIWKAFMEPANAFFPSLDWDRPAPPTRPNARLYLPGNECALRVVGSAPAPIDPNAPTTTTTTPLAPVDPEAPPVETVPPATVPVYESVQVGTTIAPDNLDPLAPLPSLPVTDQVGPCTGGTLILDE